MLPHPSHFRRNAAQGETQALLVQLESDLLPLLDGAARGSLDPETHLVSRGAAVCVVLASGGYPRSYEKGKPISGLEEAEALEQVVVFHAGTRRGPDGGFVSDGGRVLGVTARGRTLESAVETAYNAVEMIQFKGAHYRTDIGAKALR